MERITSFLHHRQQRVKISHVEYSSWVTINGGVPQGTKLGPLLFLVMIDDLQPTGVDNLKFVDDTSVSETVPKRASSQLPIAMQYVESWTAENDMVLHPTKTKEILVSFLNNPPALPPVVINSHTVEQVNSAKLLGVTISRDLKWQEHISNIVHKASSRLYFITILKRCSA